MKRLFIGLSIVLGSVSSFAALTHSYDFDGDATDSIGSWDGTAGSGTTYTDFSAEGDSSLVLDGSGSVVIEGAELATDFSIEMCIYVDSVGSSIQTLLATGIAESHADGFKLFYNSWDTKDQGINLESGTGEYDSGCNIVPSETMPVGEWCTLTFGLYGETGIGEIYLNGQLVATGLLADFSRDQDIYIGQFSDGNFDASGVYIDSLKIYNEVVPEPATTGLLVIGMGLMAGARRFKRRLR